MRPEPRARGRRTSAPAPGVLALGALALATLAACAADDHARRDGAGARTVTRTGIPVLMDLPIVGFLFGRTTTTGGVDATAADATPHGGPTPVHGASR